MCLTVLLHWTNLLRLSSELCFTSVERGAQQVANISAGCCCLFVSLPVCWYRGMWRRSHPAKVRSGNAALLQVCFHADDSLPFAFVCFAFLRECLLFFHQTLTFRLLPNSAKVGMSVHHCNSEEPGFPVDWSARSCSLGIGSELISRAKEIKCLRGLATCDGEMECEMTTRWEAGGSRSRRHSGFESALVLLGLEQCE